MSILDLSFRFDLWWARLAKSPRDLGRVELCVLRTGPGQRSLPRTLDVEPGRGAIGDAWPTHEHSHPQNELALVNLHVLRSLAGDDPVRMALSGDQLVVDLDLSEENLPVGSLLEIGTAVLRVSELQHRACIKFVRRFGALAAKQVARANRMGRRGRGVVCTVAQAGTIAVHDPIVVRRPTKS